MECVYQTRYGEPHGNCWMACIASILELPLSECPDLSPCAGDGAAWWKISQEFCLEHDRLLVYLPYEGQDGVVSLAPPLAPSGWSILGGMAERPEGLIRHAVVALNGDVVHDPNGRTPTGIVKPEDWTILVPVVHSRCRLTVER